MRLLEKIHVTEIHLNCSRSDRFQFTLLEYLDRTGKLNSDYSKYFTFIDHYFLLIASGIRFHGIVKSMKIHFK